MLSLRFVWLAPHTTNRGIYTGILRQIPTLPVSHFPPQIVFLFSTVRGSQQPRRLPHQERVRRAGPRVEARQLPEARALRGLRPQWRRPPLKGGLPVAGPAGECSRSRTTAAAT